VPCQQQQAQPPSMNLAWQARSVSPPRDRTRRSLSPQLQRSPSPLRTNYQTTSGALSPRARSPSPLRTNYQTVSGAMSPRAAAQHVPWAFASVGGSPPGSLGPPGGSIVVPVWSNQMPAVMPVVMLSGGGGAGAVSPRQLSNAGARSPRQLSGGGAFSPRAGSPGYQMAGSLQVAPGRITSSGSCGASQAAANAVQVALDRSESNAASRNSLFASQQAAASTQNTTPRRSAPLQPRRMLDSSRSLDSLTSTGGNASGSTAAGPRSGLRRVLPPQASTAERSRAQPSTAEQS